MFVSQSRSVVDGSGLDRIPQNYDYRYQVFLFAAYSNYESSGDQTFLSPTNYVASASGLTTFTDC